MGKTADLSRREEYVHIKEICLIKVEKKKEYERQYYQKHKDKRSAYRKEHRDKILAYNKLYRQRNRNKYKEYKKQYYKEHRNEILAYQKQWYETHRDEMVAYQKRYQKEHRNEVLAYQKQWYETHRNEILVYEKQWYEQNKEKRDQRVKAWKNNHIEQWHEIERRHGFKRRSLGFIPLNKPFEGSEAHHICPTFVIYIPKNMHQSISHNVWTGKNMDEINALAFNYLLETSIDAKVGKRLRMLYLKKKRGDESEKERRY